MSYVLYFLRLFKKIKKAVESRTVFCVTLLTSLDDTEIERWNIFWEYLYRQWVPILDSWNICDEDGKYKEAMKLTNNGLRIYNNRFNGLFDKKPSLLEFCEVFEAERRYQAQVLEDIRMGRMYRPTYQGVSIPAVPQAYRVYVVNLLN